MNKGELVNSKNRFLKRGIIILAISILPFLGVVVNLFDTGQHQSHNGLMKIAHTVAPDNASLPEIIETFLSKKPASLLTQSNVIALVIILVFIYGCLQISAWNQKSNRLDKLKREATDEQIKQEIKQALK